MSQKLVFKYYLNEYCIITKLGQCDLSLKSIYILYPSCNTIHLTQQSPVTQKGTQQNSWIKSLINVAICYLLKWPNQWLTLRLVVVFIILPLGNAWPFFKFIIENLSCNISLIIQFQIILGGCDFRRSLGRYSSCGLQTMEFVLFLFVISLKWANCLKVVVRQPSEQRQMPKGRDERKIALW